MELPGAPFVAWLCFFIGSFLVMRLISRWTKTGWKAEWKIAAVQAVIFTILLAVLSHHSHN